MSFFEGLCNRAGPRFYEDFMGLLARYLGPYGILLAMTCKTMKTELKPLKGPENLLLYNYSGSYDFDGHLGLLQWWMYTAGNACCPYVISKNLDVVKWKISKGLQDTGSMLSVVCQRVDVELVDFCIERRYSLHGWWLSNDVTILDYCYRVKRLTPDRNRWKDGFVDAPEEVYEWAMQYQTDPMFSFQEIGDRFHRVIESWSRRKFKNIYMMQIYVERHASFSPVPTGICQLLTPEVAIALDSDKCQCEYAGNHENRKKRR